MSLLVATATVGSLSVHSTYSNVQHTWWCCSLVLLVGTLKKSLMDSLLEIALISNRNAARRCEKESSRAFSGIRLRKPLFSGIRTFPIIIITVGYPGFPQFSWQAAREDTMMCLAQQRSSPLKSTLRRAIFKYFFFFYAQRCTHVNNVMMLVM